MIRALSTSSLVVAAVLWAAAPAAAQTATAKGEALFKQGMDLRAAGKLAEACDAFAASDKADPNLGTLMYLGDCREANGELTSAWAAFLEAEKRSRGATDDESVQINGASKARAAQLEPRLSKLTLIVPPESRLEGLSISVSADPFPSSSWNLEVPVDGKTYVITVRAPDHQVWKTTITVGPEHDRKSLKIPTLALAATDKSGAKTVYIEHPERPLAMRLLPYGLVAISVGAFTGAIIYERSSGRYVDHSEVEPDDAKQLELWDKAKAQRYKAIALGAGGLACVGVATWLWLRGRSQDQAPAIAINPVAGGAVAAWGTTW